MTRIRKLSLLFVNEGKIQTGSRSRLPEGASVGRKVRNRCDGYESRGKYFFLPLTIRINTVTIQCIRKALTKTIGFKPGTESLCMVE